MRTLIILLISLFTFKGYSQTFNFNEDFVVMEEHRNFSSNTLDDFVEKSVSYFKEMSLVNKIHEAIYIAPYIEPYYNIREKITNTKPTKVKGQYIVTPKPEVVSKTDNNKFAVILYNTLHFKVVVSKKGNTFVSTMYFIVNDKPSKNIASRVTFTPGEDNKLITEMSSSELRGFYNYFLGQRRAGKI